MPAKISTELRRNLKSLGTSLGRFADQLERLGEKPCDSKDLPEVISRIYSRASESWLATAKQLTETGGRSSLVLGELSSAADGIAYALEEEIPWLAAEQFSSFSGSLHDFASGLRQEAIDLGCGNALGDTLDFLVNGADMFGSAGELARITGREIGAGRLTEGLESSITMAAPIRGAAESILGFRTALIALTFNPWANSCTCGATRWVADDIFLSAWRWQRCTLVEGWFCDTCEWRDAGVARYHPRIFTPRPGS